MVRRLAGTLSCCHGSGLALIADLNAGQNAKLCRLCAFPLRHSVIDLASSPLAETYLSPDCLDQPELFYPLHAKVCESCFLVQVAQAVAPADLFSEYAYFSSFSDSWVQHAKNYVEGITARFALGPESQVIEVASNDGYLLQFFREEQIPVLGIEPARNVAQAAFEKGIPTVVEFLGESIARSLVKQGKQADLIVANNVLAQVPDLHDFVSGLKLLLKPNGVMTLEFPHLLSLIGENQFDTIYHEHFSYFSLKTAENLFARHKLAVFDVEKLETHGGSLRLYVTHSSGVKTLNPSLATLREEEKHARLENLDTYSLFSSRVRRVKRDFLAFLIEAREKNKSIVAYGAPAKGNTFLNYCGIRTDLIDYTVDRNPYKHGKLLPGVRIPIFPIAKIKDTKPDFLLILPWNLKAEIMAQIAFIREWGGQFVVAIPSVEVYT